MSYNIRIYRKEVKQAEQESKDKNFFENEGNIMRFTEELFDQLKSRLLKYGYKIKKETFEEIFFENDKEETEALLTRFGLFFSAFGEGVFEISMTLSEFTDNGLFAKYDPQNGGWEDE